MADAKRQPGGADAALSGRNGSRWYASFYWRIGISFVAFLIAVIAAHRGS